MSIHERIDIGPIPRSTAPLRTGDGRIIEDTPEGRAAHAAEIRKMFEEFEAIWAAEAPDEDPHLDDEILKALEEGRR